MKKLLSTLPLLLLVTIAWCQASEKRTPGDFSGVSGATGLEITLTQGNDNSVTVSASEQKYVDAVQTTVENGVLKISYKNNTNFTKKDKGKNVKVAVTYKAINTIKGSSGATITASGTVSSSSLKLNMNSGAMFNGAIKTDELTLDQSSGAISTVSGTATSVKADISSGGIFTGTDVTSETCMASASTGGILKIGVTKKLTASVSTGGVINYKGSPEVDKKSVSTGGVISKI